MRGSAVAMRHISGWQIVTLVLVLTAAIAASAVALILGKDALISIAIVVVIGMVVVAWLNNSVSVHFSPLRRTSALRK